MTNKSMSVALVGTVVALLVGTPSVAMAATAPAAPSEAIPASYAVDEAVSPEADTVVVSGQTYGPEDGLEVTTESYDVVSGEGPVGAVYGDAPVITPFATWGSSYAISTETAYLFFTGRAKAAGNVYNNQRIIKVCISYSHPGRSSDTVCSSAYSTGSRWIAGNEVSVSFVDNLSDNWPQTDFNIETTRINPNLY